MWDQSPQANSFDSPMVDASQHSFISGNPVLDDMHSWQGHDLQQEHMQGQFIHQNEPMANAHQEPDMWLTGTMPAHPLRTNYQATSFSQSPSFPQTTTGVNPNLIFSFSSPIHNVMPSTANAPAPPPNFDPLSRQPYEQQVRESNRERELAQKSRQQQQKEQQQEQQEEREQQQQQQQQQEQQQPGSQHNRVSSVVGISNRPALQRSNTDSGFRRNKTRSLDGRSAAIQAVQAAEHIPRKPSPLKRLSQVSLSSIPEGSFRIRPRTRLIIDDSGTARTETVTDDDDDLPQRRSFGHWADEDSDEEDLLVTSQRNSFILSSDLLRPTKYARLDSDEEEAALHKRPLSSASLNSLTSRMGATPLGRKMSMEARRRLSQESHSSSIGDRELAASSQDTILGRGDDDGEDDDDGDRGDAQNALKKLVGGRSRRGEFNGCRRQLFVR
jgi:hypothetical protein